MDVLPPYRYKHFSIALVVLSFCTRAFCVEPNPDVPRPWLTGPLIATSAEVVPAGHFNVEPYVYAYTFRGQYGRHWGLKRTTKSYQLNTQLVLKTGLYKRVALAAYPQYLYNRTQGTSSNGFGDLPLGVEIQLLEDKKGSFPLKLFIQETLPTGKYQKLSASKKGTDAIGSGSFNTLVGLAAGKLFHWKGAHYLNVEANLSITYFAPVSVHGLNAYGGDKGTRGIVYPGTSLNLDCAAEYTFTKHWAFAIDCVGNFAQKNRFKGHTKTKMGAPSSIQISLAPAIEYNFSETLGIIAGSWFTVAGRNSKCFYSAVIAVNYYR